MRRRSATVAAFEEGHPLCRRTRGERSICGQNRAASCAPPQRQGAGSDHLATSSGRSVWLISKRCAMWCSCVSPLYPMTWKLLCVRRRRAPSSLLRMIDGVRHGFQLDIVRGIGCRIEWRRLRAHRLHEVVRCHRRAHVGDRIDLGVRDPEVDAPVGGVFGSVEERRELPRVDDAAGARRGELGAHACRVGACARLNQRGARGAFPAAMNAVEVVDSVARVGALSHVEDRRHGAVARAPRRERDALQVRVLDAALAEAVVDVGEELFVGAGLRVVLLVRPGADADVDDRKRRVEFRDLDALLHDRCVAVKVD